MAKREPLHFDLNNATPAVAAAVKPTATAANDVTERQQVGARVTKTIYRQLKSRAALQGVTVQALVEQAPEESSVHFGGPDGRPQGIVISELSSDQKDYAQKVLDALVEPYRTTDRDEVLKCLKAQGGLDKCRLAFYKSDDLGNDGEWDNWRLEGPSFVWHYRGTPHVHVWVNVADNPTVKITTGG